LLSRALYRMFKKDPAEFLPKYEEFLRLAGTEPAEKLVQHTIGRDIEQPQFWAEAIDSLEEPLAQLEILLGEVL
jgi:oligoendopeptidase F